MKKYGIKAGAHVKTSAQTIGMVCDDLQRMNKLTPQNLVDVSRSEDAPLHDEFEWNDSIAGEKYREHQARYLIRVVTIVPEEEKKAPIRAFVSIPQLPDGKRKYVDTQFALSIPKTSEIVLMDAKRELNAFERKYKNLSEEAGIKELDGIFTEIRKLTA